MIAKTSACLLGILLCLLCGGFIQSAWAYSTDDLKRLKATGSCPRCDLSAATLDELQLFRSNLSGANLSGANLTDADLVTANLSPATLLGATLIRTNLSDTNLVKANFEEANLFHTNLTGAIVTNGRYIIPELRAAKLCYSILPNVRRSFRDCGTMDVR